MAIRQLRIKNYTSHKDSAIDFDPGVTSIIGFSEQGKTNIFHALRTVCFAENWPVADIRDFQDSGEIELVLDDGRKVRDKRTQRSREIQLINARGLVEHTLQGNAGVRERIEDWTGIRKVQVDPDGRPEDINFIQVDESMPVTGQPETVQRRILNVVGGSAIEQGRVRLAARIKSLKEGLASSNTLLTDLVNEREGIVQLLEKCKPLEEELSEVQEQIKSLNELASTYEEYLKIFDDHQRISTLGMLRKFRDLKKQYEELTAEWQHLEHEQRELEDVLDKLQALEQQVVAGSKNLEEAKRELAELHDQAAEFEVCPTCKRPL